jgi:hypothetical protein
LKADIERLTAELTAERERGVALLAAAENRAGQAMAELAVERATRQADQGEQAAQIAQHYEQLAAARLAAEKATAELLALAAEVAGERERSAGHRGDYERERERADLLAAALADLKGMLEAATARPRPWWRRVLRRV